jgi:hypothetical protein
MGDINSAEVFTSVVPGNAVTATRLNNDINAAVIQPSFLSSKSDISPVLADSVLVYQLSGTRLIGPTLTHFFAAQIVDAAFATGSLRTLGNSGNKAAPGATTPGLAIDNTYTGRQTFNHIGASTPGVAVAVNAVDTTGAGVGATAVLAAGSTDTYGRITLTPAGVPGASVVQCTLTFGSAFISAPFPDIYPYESNALTVQATVRQVRVSGVTTALFALTSGPTALVAGTSYVFGYHVFGT